jgi:hypothetical protein
VIRQHQDFVKKSPGHPGLFLLTPRCRRGKGGGQDFVSLVTVEIRSMNASCCRQTQRHGSQLAVEQEATMAATDSAQSQIPARTMAKSDSENHRAAERLGRFDIIRSRDARCRLRVLVSAKKFIASFDFQRGATQH